MPCPKGHPAPVITQDDPEQKNQPAPLPNPNRRSNTLNKYISSRITGIAAAAINQFTGISFLEDMRRTITVNGTPLDPEEIANVGVHPVTKKP